MKYVLAFLLLAVSAPLFADQAVRGYVRKDGTYVAPYMRSSPDSDRANNWSSRGNVNPYTGQPGYRDPYAPQQQQPNYNSPRKRY